MVRAFAGDSTMTRRFGTAGHDSPHRGRRRRRGVFRPGAGGSAGGASSRQLGILPPMPPRPPLIYNVVAVFSWPLLYGLFRLRVRGRENVPASGGFILACNHLSNFDAWPLAMPIWPRRWLRFMAKVELYWWPATYVLDAAGAFKVHRDRADVEAIETAVRLAREGNVVVVFPEGTRRRKGLVKRHQARP